jgi:predicted trehalose synthase
VARHDGDLRANAGAPLGIDELLALLGDDARLDAESRQHAIACYLSGSDGWREAVKQLRGAFAERDTGLRDGKSD